MLLHAISSQTHFNKWSISEVLANTWLNTRYFLTVPNDKIEMDDDGGGNSNDDLRKERERVCGDVTKCRKNTGTQSKPFHVKVPHLFMVINAQDITVNKVHTKLICYQVYPKQFNRSLKNAPLS